MELKIKFYDSSPSFVYGVEYGRLLERFEKGLEVITNNGFPVRIENIDLLKDTCETYGYCFVTNKTSIDGWVDFTAIKNKSTDN